MAESQISNEKSTNCLNCTFKAVNKEELFKHVRVHQYDHNFRIACPHCPQILKHLESYRKHIKCCLKKLAFTWAILVSLYPKSITYKATPNQMSEVMSK